MKFEKNQLVENKLFFILVPIVLVIIAVLSIFINATNDRSILDEEELSNGQEKAQKLVMNEVMTSNKGAYKDESGKLYDYLELYNGKDHDINLKGYGLSDVANAVKWTFPDVTIKSKGYLVVFLSGKTDGKLHANFKLKSAGGENIALRNPSGKIIDAITTISTIKNNVMARNLEGNWVIQTKPTPGYANTIKGYEAFQKSLIGEEEDLVITEIMPNNKGNFKDNYGNYSGYIEIMNVGNKTISLQDYGLSNEEEASFKWQFSNIKIKSGEIVLVFTSNRNITNGILHASFKLNNENGVVVLSNNKGKIISKVTYQNVPNGLAYIKGEKTYQVSSGISPGYFNNADGIELFEKTRKTNQTLIVNEAMNSNYKYLAQNGGKYYDWIELKNNSDKEVELNKYYLTTNTDNMTMYQLPDKKLGKDEYYVVMASGNKNLSNNSYRHTNFKLGEVECIYLTDGTSIIDTLFVAEVPTGYSVGKGDKSGVYYYSSPTPKTKNKSGAHTISYAPSFSLEGGTYNDVKSITIEIEGENTIYYTTNGSTPSTSSKKYKGPIVLKKTTVLKAITKQSGKLNSKVVTASYIINERHTLPVMSLSINSNKLSNLHSHAWNQGYEVGPCYIEYYDDNESFEIPCGLQLFGGSTRGHPKKSYELTFKKKYGSGKLEYQVFENWDFSSFDNLVLRTGSQDEFQGRRKSLIRDLVVSDLVEEYTSVDIRSYKSVILYINGKYRGIYFLREKIDENYVSNNYNISNTGKTDIIRIDGAVKAGNKKKYNQLMNYVNTHSMKNNKYYQEIEKQVDIDNLIDYWIAQTFTTNNDIVKNSVMFSNPEIDNGKWKFILYDMDFSMYHPGVNYFAFSTNPKGMQGFSSATTQLLRNLMKNKNFRKRYLERLNYNLDNTWSVKNVVSKIDEVTKELKPEMKRNLNRWGGSYSEWQNEVKFLKTFTVTRHKYLKSQIKSYFGLSNSEYKKYFG